MVPSRSLKNARTRLSSLSTQPHQPLGISLSTRVLASSALMAAGRLVLTAADDDDDVVPSPHQQQVPWIKIPVHKPVRLPLVHVAEPVRHLQRQLRCPVQARLDGQLREALDCRCYWSAAPAMPGCAATATPPFTPS